MPGATSGGGGVDVGAFGGEGHEKVGSGHRAREFLDGAGHVGRPQASWATGAEAGSHLLTSTVEGGPGQPLRPRAAFHSSGRNAGALVRCTAASSALRSLSSARYATASASSSSRS